MSAFEPYIIIDLDQGRRCYTRGDPVIKTFENEEYSFVSGVSDVRLPGSSVKPGSGASLGSGRASITIFNDGLTPGSLLATYSRVQGCRIRVYVEERSGASTLAFDGEINSVAHSVKDGKITLEGGPVHATIAVPFPSATTLEEGRLVTRQSEQVTFVPQAYSLPDLAADGDAPAFVETPRESPRATATATFIWLRDAMEFRTIFGTPSSPAYIYADASTSLSNGEPRVVFHKTKINQLDGSAEYYDGGTITDPETFLWWESSAKDEPVPVVYGSGINMPLKPFAHYRVTYCAGVDVAPADVKYAKVYIYPVACHPVVGDPRLVVQDASLLGETEILQVGAAPPYGASTAPGGHQLFALNASTQTLWFYQNQVSPSTKTVLGTYGNTVTIGGWTGSTSSVSANANQHGYYEATFSSATGSLAAGWVASNNEIAVSARANVGFTVKPDFLLALRWGDNHHASNMLSAGSLAYEGGQAGYSTTDRLNGAISYVTLAVPYKPPSDVEGLEVEAWEEILDDPPYAHYKDFEPGRVWALMCKGKESTQGRAITGLGDVIRDAWTTFGAGAADTVDWNLSALATSRLNAYAVDMVVNGSKEDQTLERVLNSRVSKQFPVAFGFPRGKTAWQCTALPLEAGAASRLLVLGEDLVERVSVTESSRTSIQNAVTVTFGMDGARAGTRFTVVADHTNNNTCRASVSRWGKSQRNKLSLPDSQDAPTAARIAREFVEQSAGVRITARYLTDDASFLHMPMFTVLGVTDLEAGFDEERFYYLGYEWGADLTTLSINLLSVSMV